MARAGARKSSLENHPISTRYGLFDKAPYDFKYSQSRSTDTLVASQNNSLRKGRYVGGGNFLLHKRQLEVHPSPECRVQYVSGFYAGRTVQVFRAIPSVAPFTNAPVSAGSHMAPPATLALELLTTAGYGPEMWRRARPGNATAQALVGLKEIVTEGLPSLPLRLLSRVHSLRSVGKEYLNVVFGWRPLVKEIQDMYQTYVTLDKKLSQLVRDNGRLIRRRREKGVQTSSTAVVTSGGGYPYSQPTIVGVTSGNIRYQRTVYTEKTERIWFAGGFRYYVPDIGSDRWTKHATRALFGANLTPEVVWQALPWSWLVDWFANVGHVISNMSSNAVDNLVADYAYVMREVRLNTRTEVQIWLPGSGAAGERYSQASLTSSFEDKTYLGTRVPATPYGFNVSWDSLSAYRLSVLAALGLSKSRF